MDTRQRHRSTASPLQRFRHWTSRDNIAWFDVLPYASADMNKTKLGRLERGAVVQYLLIALLGVAAAYLFANV